MENVRSFTGRALFNPYALDFLHPTGFNKCSIEHRDSVIAALRDSTINPYMNPRNTSYWSLLSRLHLLAPLQIVYSSAVTLTASRLGVVVNGLLTVGSFVKSYLADLRNQKHELEKTREYAFAFFTDLFCAVAGTYLTKAMIEHTVCALHFARVTSFMGKCYLKPIPSAFSFALSMTVAIVSALAFFSIQQPNIAPSLFVEDKYRVGMYLSLFLRKHLGTCVCK
ncbi:MAG: hypothetical protein LVR00_01475 [Rhabdochlamydiaceae bacterium]|jgi:hypothetical protein